jgi:hypothetical protein
MMALGENVDMVHVSGAKRVLPLLLVKLRAHARDQFRSVKVQMHLPHAERWKIGQPGIGFGIRKANHRHGGCDNSCFDKITAIDACVHCLIPFICCTESHLAGRTRHRCRSPVAAKDRKHPLYAGQAPA